MAPTTRFIRFQTPFPESLAVKEATTTQKCKFFDVLARDGDTKSLHRISKDCGIDENRLKMEGPAHEYGKSCTEINSTEVFST